jgi:BMFP domain-containing protein YqiC
MRTKNLLNSGEIKEKAMLNTKLLDDLSIRFRELVNSSPAGDLQKNMRALLEGAFTKLELVSREEFDVQADVLRSTREKLQLLEKKLEQLEDSLHQEHNKE